MENQFRFRYYLIIHGEQERVRQFISAAAGAGFSYGRLTLADSSIIHLLPESIEAVIRHLYIGILRPGDGFTDQSGMVHVYAKVLLLDAAAPSSWRLAKSRFEDAGWIGPHVLFAVDRLSKQETYTLEQIKTLMRADGALWFPCDTSRPEDVRSAVLQLVRHMREETENGLSER